MIDKELHARCLATQLTIEYQKQSNKNIECSQSGVFEIVKTYENFYDYVINSFETT